MKLEMKLKHFIFGSMISLFYSNRIIDDLGLSNQKIIMTTKVQEFV